MRLWTVHPRYLDAKGLVAVWREALLAQKVLQGATKGYKHHPQLVRFQAAPDPLAAIATYLIGVHDEAERRGYAFEVSRIAHAPQRGLISDTKGQLLYEWSHLKHKFQTRDPVRYWDCQTVDVPRPHSLCRIVAGEVEAWERVT